LAPTNVCAGAKIRVKLFRAEELRFAVTCRSARVTRKAGEPGGAPAGGSLLPPRT
jgi:hypothetical protein